MQVMSRGTFFSLYLLKRRLNFFCLIPSMIVRVVKLEIRCAPVLGYKLKINPWLPCLAIYVAVNLVSAVIAAASSVAKL
jgi:hypothetical protein